MIPWDVKNSQALAWLDLPSMWKLMLSVTDCNILPADSKDQYFEFVLDNPHFVIDFHLQEALS
jgi:hypothetical protein